MVLKKICGYCGKEFENRAAIYCSTSCATNYFDAIYSGENLQLKVVKK